MGIIIKQSKLVFDELIGSNSFDDIFKNSLRDYYTYGFKSYNEFHKGRQSMYNRWTVFSKIMGEKWEFRQGKQGRNQIILNTNSVGIENQMDELYHLHNISSIGDYLNYLIDLDSKSMFNGDSSELPVNEETLTTVSNHRLEEVNEFEFAIIDNWFNEINSNMIKKQPVIRIDRQLYIWTINTRLKSKNPNNKYNNLINRLIVLNHLGVIDDLRYRMVEKEKWGKQQWEQYCGAERKRFYRPDNTDENSLGNHYWYKSPITMESIINRLCDAVDSREKQNCINDFRTMCEFFSQYHPLGVIGTFFSERCESVAISYNKDCFRFKHNYLQKSLYDYNLVDIFLAIENGFLCLIEYSHGMGMNRFQEIIKPLEIRISVENGREYVLYYNIEKNKLSAMRLEFIDKIVIYTDIKKVTKIKEKISKVERKIKRVIVDESDILIDVEKINKQAMIAEQMLPYIWGTEVPQCSVDDQWPKALIHFKHPIIYNYSNEQFIEHRVKREQRIKSEDKDMISIFPTKEMRSWLRSFYTRVNVSSETELDGFKFIDDVNAFYELYLKNGVLPGKSVYKEKKEKENEYYENTYIVEGISVPVTYGHGALFNELFSKYAIVMADSVLEYMDHPERSDLKMILGQNIKKTLSYYSETEQKEVCNELMFCIKKHELVNNNGKPRFLLKGGKYLYNILPLTKIELRWLLTILDDPMSHIFLTESQCLAIKEEIKKSLYPIKKLPLDLINYYDRYHTEKGIENEAEKLNSKKKYPDEKLIRIIYQAIKNQTKLKIDYLNYRGDERSVICLPVWLEYSKRDNLFRIWSIHRLKDKNVIQQINVFRVKNIETLYNEHYDREEQKKILERLREQTMKSIEVEFYQGEKNLPDRILTEFSLWKKECRYDVHTSLYRMILYYSSIDEKEILIRLLRYGPYIKIITTDDNYILCELKKRIVKQRKLILRNDLKQNRDFTIQKPV